MNLSVFYKSKYKKICIVMKSGAEIRFECEAMTWKMDGQLNIVSYQINKFKSTTLNYIQPADISAILTEA